MPRTSKARAVGLNHIALEVGDIEEALAFHGRLFEFTLRGKSEHAAFIDLGDQFLALQKGRKQPSDDGRHFIAASTVNAVQCKQDRPDCARLQYAADFAKALKLDVSAWFTPTADSYFNRVNRAQILADIDEAKGEHAPALEKLKKPELAIRAEGLVAGTSWLRQAMRTAANENVSQDQAITAAAE